MVWLIAKYLLTAGVIVVISEVAKRNDKLGALMTALPLVTFSVLIWMNAESQNPEKMGRYVVYVFWYVVPTLPMFLLFPAMLERFGFWPALAAFVAGILLCFGIEAWILKRFGIDLL